MQDPDEPLTEKWNIALLMSKHDDVFMNQPKPGRVIFAKYYYQGTDLWEYEPMPPMPDWVTTFMGWIRTVSNLHINTTVRIGE